MILDFIGLFLFLSGFVIGLGAVNVIDWHGALAARSSYWTEATIRTHKITKPLIWVGIFLAVVGGLIFYRETPLVGIPVWHAFAATILIINGIFLSFYISPRLLQREQADQSQEILPWSLQWKIIVSLIVSDILWWSSLVLLTWFLIGR